MNVFRQRKTAKSEIKLSESESTMRNDWSNVSCEQESVVVPVSVIQPLKMFLLEMSARQTNKKSPKVKPNRHADLLYIV